MKASKRATKSVAAIATEGSTGESQSAIDGVGIVGEGGLFLNCSCLDGQAMRYSTGQLCQITLDTWEMRRLRSFMCPTCPDMPIAHGLGKLERLSLSAFRPATRRPGDPANSHAPCRR